jgi:RNA polymerase sigma-70 factor, ECF subfamily
VIAGRVAPPTGGPGRGARPGRRGGQLTGVRVNTRTEAAVRAAAKRPTKARLRVHLVLERLSPAERTAFVLHDVFQYPYDAIAEIVGRTPAACRQLASRARRTITENVDGPGRGWWMHATTVSADVRGTP